MKCDTLENGKENVILNIYGKISIVYLFYRLSFTFLPSGARGECCA